MTIAWYDPTNHHVSTNKNDPLFTPLGQLLPLDVQREWVDMPPQDYAEIFVTARNIDHASRLTAAKLKERNA
jgi:hypothetical protein